MLSWFKKNTKGTQELITDYWTDVSAMVRLKVTHETGETYLDEEVSWRTYQKDFEPSNEWFLGLLDFRAGLYHNSEFILYHSIKKVTLVCLWDLKVDHYEETREAWVK